MDLKSGRLIFMIVWNLGQVSKLTDHMYNRIKPPENRPWEKVSGYENKLSCLKFLD